MRFLSRSDNANKDTRGLTNWVIKKHRLSLISQKEPVEKRGEWGELVYKLRGEFANDVVHGLSIQVWEYVLER
jgi:hypothetical protein